MSTKVLHVIGSPDSKFYKELSIFYASSCIEYDDFEFYYAFIHVGGLWSFPKTFAAGEAAAEMGDDERLTLDKAIVKILDIKPDVIIWHMLCVRGFTIYRALIEALNIPLLGSGSECAYIAQNKATARGIYHQHGIRIPAGVIVHKGDINLCDIYRLGFPCVVKPARRENSDGVTLVRDKAQLENALNIAHQLDRTAVVERFIRGSEIRTGIISDSDGNLRMLTPFQYMDVEPENIRGLDAKLEVNDDGLLVGKSSLQKLRFLDVEQEAGLIQRLTETSFKAFKALELRDFGLFDFRVDDDGLPWLLEVNMVCSFGPKSVLAGMAEPAGISCHALLKQMVKNALSRENSLK